MGRIHSRRAYLLLTRIAALLTLGATLATAASVSASTRRIAGGRIFVQNACAPVYASATPRSTLLTQLIGGSDVTALDAVSAGGSSWEHVRIWSGIDGYIPASQLGAEPPASPSEGDCAFPGLPDTPNAVIPPDSGPAPFTQSGVVDAPETVFSRPDDRSSPLGAAAVGAAVTTTEWSADANGFPW